MLIHQPESNLLWNTSAVAHQLCLELGSLCNSRQGTPQNQERGNDSVRCGSVVWCKLWQPRWDTQSKDLCCWDLRGQEVEAHIGIHIVTECHDMSLVITIFTILFVIYLYYTDAYRSILLSDLKRCSHYSLSWSLESLKPGIDSEIET